MKSSNPILITLSHFRPNCRSLYLIDETFLTLIAYTDLKKLYDTQHTVHVVTTSVHTFTDESDQVFHIDVTVVTKLQSGGLLEFTGTYACPCPW